MPRAERYEDLIFELGDLARERLVNKPDRPRSMNRVLQAEDAVLARREALEAVESQINEEDAAFQEAMAAIEDEKKEHAKIVQRFQKTVDSVEAQVKGLRKKLSRARADARYNKEAIKKAEAKHADLELTTQDPSKLTLSRENLKKLRLAVMRKDRELEEMERQLEVALTPRPGQPGGAGLTANKQISDLNAEAEQRKADFEALMTELDQQMAVEEEEVQAAEDYLDQAIFLLGEECYQTRISDPALASFYPRLDRSK